MAPDDVRRRNMLRGCKTAIGVAHHWVKLLPVESEAEPTVREMAARVGISERSFVAHTRRLTGRSPHGLLRLTPMVRELIAGELRATVTDLRRALRRRRACEEREA